MLNAQRERSSRAAPHRAEHRLRREDGGEQGHERADAEREGEALDARGGEHEEDEGDAEGDRVRVDDGPQRLRVAGLDRARDRPSEAGLFLDPLEDDDVRVRRDAERQDQARDARQRQRDRYQLHEREQQQRVDDERQARDYPQHAIEEQQQEQRQRQSHGARDEALVERLLAERGRDLRLGDQLQLDPERADAQVLGEVVGLLDAAETADLGAVRAVDAVRILRVVDRGERDDLVVERDREVLKARRPRRPGRQDLRGAALREPLRDSAEGRLAGAGEVELDDRASGRVLDDLRIGDLVARQLGVVLEHVVGVVRRLARGALRVLCLDQDDALGDLDDDAALGRADALLGEPRHRPRTGRAPRRRTRVRVSLRAAAEAGRPLVVLGDLAAALVVGGRVVRVGELLDAASRARPGLGGSPGGWRRCPDRRGSTSFRTCRSGGRSTARSAADCRGIER